MSTPVFSFGHPCEHQLRRTCIGGNSCPLNGYPDTWCCSYVKGKISFKRDKPCEGPRCRWGFVHPPPSGFDTVTQLIADARAVTNTFEEICSGAEVPEGTDIPTLIPASSPNSAANNPTIVSFNLDQQHILDAAHCVLHFLRIPTAACGRQLGQMYIYAALRAHEPKVFTQLLRPMRKPVDIYLIGAMDYINHKIQERDQLAAKKGKKVETEADEEAGKKKNRKKALADETLDELKNDVVEIMNSALSAGGQLVDREDQRQLQGIFITALRTFPRTRKKSMEMLENAVAKFGDVAVMPTDAIEEAKKAVQNLPSLGEAAGEEKPKEKEPPVAGGNTKDGKDAKAGDKKGDNLRAEDSKKKEDKKAKSGVTAIEPIAAEPERNTESPVPTTSPGGSVVKLDSFESAAAAARLQEEREAEEREEAKLAAAKAAAKNLPTLGEAAGEEPSPPPKLTKKQQAAAAAAEKAAKEAERKAAEKLERERAARDAKQKAVEAQLEREKAAAQAAAEKAGKKTPPPVTTTTKKAPPAPPGGIDSPPMSSPTETAKDDKAGKANKGKNAKGAAAAPKPPSAVAEFESPPKKGDDSEKKASGKAVPQPPSAADASPDREAAATPPAVDQTEAPGTPNLVTKPGLSKFESSNKPKAQPYYPITAGTDLPDILIMGGLFGLGPKSAASAPLGPASTTIVEAAAAKLGSKGPQSLAAGSSVLAAPKTNSPPPPSSISAPPAGARTPGSSSLGGSAGAPPSTNPWGVSSNPGSSSIARAASAGAIGTPPSQSSSQGVFPSYPAAGRPSAPPGMMGGSHGTPGSVGVPGSAPFSPWGATGSMFATPTTPNPTPTLMPGGPTGGNGVGMGSGTGMYGSGSPGVVVGGPGSSVLLGSPGAGGGGGGPNPPSAIGGSGASLGGGGGMRTHSPHSVGSPTGSNNSQDTHSMLQNVLKAWGQ